MNIIETKVEKLENSAAKVTVIIDKKETSKAYKNLLNKYAKEAQIKGFRKGKVPTSILEKKYGEGIKAESFMNVIDEAWKEVIENLEEKPLGYVAPELEKEEEMVFDFDKDFSFSIKYDVFPTFELENYKDIEVSRDVVKIGKAEIADELKKLQEQNAMVITKADKTVEKNNVVTVNFTEVDEENNEIESSKREDFVFTVGSGYNVFKIDEDIIGMKKDEEKIITKTYSDNEEDENLKGKTKKIKVFIKEVKIKDIPELDDELAQDIDDKYETLDDLRNDIKKKLEMDVENRLKNQVLEQIISKITESTEISLPKSLLIAEAKNQMQSFAQQVGMSIEQLEKSLTAQGKNEEEIYQDFFPEIEKNLKRQLIIEKISELEKIEVSDKDIENEIKVITEQSGQNFEEMKKFYENPQYRPHIEAEVKNSKSIDFLVNNAKVKEGSKIKYIDLIKS